MPRITIIGLGLIGGSLGLALKRAPLKGLEVVGYDIDRGVSGRARKRGALDREAPTAAAALEGAAVVVIATPILHVAQALEAIAPALGEDTVVTDTASTKRQVLRWAEERLPQAVSFVGGHPIAGKEQGGIDAADPALFQGRPWALVPSLRASERAIRTVESLVRVVGAQPVPIDAEEHDSYLAAASHLPLLAATALFSLASRSESWPDLAALAGPGFRDTTRLASTDPTLSHDIYLTNRANVLHWLDRYIEELRRLRSLIESDEQQEELLTTLVKVQMDRDSFLQAPPRRPQPSEAVDAGSAGERMLSLLVGDYLARRAKDLDKLLESRPLVDDEELRRKLEGR